MRKSVLIGIMVLLAAYLVGCGGRTHPVKVYVDESFTAGTDGKIAVFPFSSAVSSAQDPNRLAPRVFDQLFRAELDKRGDYNWVAPGSVEYALSQGGLEQEAERFVDEWRKTRQANKEFLAQIGQALQVEGVLIGVVELWQQDEVDPRENAAAATYVGATVTIFGVEDGAVLFEASDEDMLESARSEDRDSQIIRSGSGQIYSDPTGSLYKAPPLDEVAVKVAEALARSIPAR
jgi:hypothetical protein